MRQCWRGSRTLFRAMTALRIHGLSRELLCSAHLLVCLQWLRRLSPWFLLPVLAILTVYPALDSQQLLSEMLLRFDLRVQLGRCSLRPSPGLSQPLLLFHLIYWQKRSLPRFLEHLRSGLAFAISTGRRPAPMATSFLHQVLG